MSSDGPQCVPLCGASKAYGKHVKWWYHEPQCPLRVKPSRAEEADDEQ